MPTFTASCKETPHCLLQFSLTEWARIKDNSIIVEGLFGTDLKSYDNVILGKNVTAPLKKSTSHGSTIHWKELNLHNVKQQYAVIVSTVKTVQTLVDIGSVILIDNLEGSAVGRAFNKKSVLSNYILLAVMQASNKNVRKKECTWKWGWKHYDFVKNAKDNIMSCSNKHHNCEGSYFSWGNKANYGMVGNSSIGQYATKNTHSAPMYGRTIVEMMNTELKSSIFRMKNVIRDIDKMVAPVMKIAYDLQAKQGDIGIKKMNASDAGVWQSSLCVNAVTKGWHTENDVTYTIISVPFQEVTSKDRDYHFLFKLQSKYTLSVPLKEGTTVLFSGKMLTHRQSCNALHADDDQLFFNFASYGNKKMHNHIRKSFIRCGI